MHDAAPIFFRYLPEYEKIGVYIAYAKNRNEFNQIILKARNIDIPTLDRKKVKIPEFKIKQYERLMNQIHPTFNIKFNIDDKNEILNSYINKFEIFCIKENNHEFISCLIKCKYSNKLILLNYGRNGFDNLLESDPYYQKDVYQGLLFYTYFFHDNDEGIRFCFAKEHIKFVTIEIQKNWYPRIKFIFPNSESNIKIKNLLENCDRNGNWFLNDYNEKTNSGFHFMNLIIKHTGAFPNKWHYIFGNLYRNEKLLEKFYPKFLLDSIKTNIMNSNQ